ncbi:MAG: hypothetical protein QXP53_02030 [Candidatus Pacearchaeota archaeon]
MEKELIVKVLFFIIDNLRSRGVWGGRHTAIYNLTKGMPSWITQTNKGRRAINYAIKVGLNNKFLLIKKSTQELHFFLNSAKSKEIIYFLKKAEDFVKTNDNKIFREICLVLRI